MFSLYIVSLLISFVSVILVIVLSKKYGYFVDPADTGKPQSFHRENTPRAGGIAILFALFPFMHLPFGSVLFLSTLLAFGSGIFEDFHRSLSPKIRLLMQLTASLSAVLLTGAVVTYLGLGIRMPYWLGMLFSLFAITGMMNAVNIIDGFNGLAAGVVLLILSSFAVVSSYQHNNEILSVVLVTMGALSGFTLLNFPKGKIFLGDGGAYMLGFLVAVIGIFLASKYETVSPWYVLALFVYPVWEVIFSIFRKLRMGRSPLKPDAYHLHMLIYRHITKSNPKTSLLIVSALIPFVTISTLFANKSNSNIAITLLFILCYTLLYRKLYRREFPSA